MKRILQDQAQVKMAVNIHQDKYFRKIIEQLRPFTHHLQVKSDPYIFNDLY